MLSEMTEDPWMTGGIVHGQWVRHSLGHGMSSLEDFAEEATAVVTRDSGLDAGEPFERTQKMAASLCSLRRAASSRF